MVENRSLLEFIDTDFAYLNVDLMKWYGLEPEQYVGAALAQSMRGDFFRIKLPDRRRGGAIASGATMVLTSTSIRSSPVFRGAWIADTILNQPVPPPPADVPALVDDTSTDAVARQSVREKLMSHRNNPSCSSCHDKIDPLGFGLEQFDAVGRIRTTYADGSRIDASGDFQGKEYSGIEEFKSALLDRKDVFVQGFAAHLLRYAINRELTVADLQAVESIAIEIAEKDYSFHSAVLAVITSPPFCGSPLQDE
jgi:hypothetical protein